MRLKKETSFDLILHQKFELKNAREQAYEVFKSGQKHP
jgi:hypothetical protein